MSVRALTSAADSEALAPKAPLIALLGAVSRIVLYYTTRMAPKGKQVRGSPLPGGLRISPPFLRQRAMGPTDNCAPASNPRFANPGLRIHSLGLSVFTPLYMYASIPRLVIGRPISRPPLATLLMSSHGWIYMICEYNTREACSD
ncbi:hypothetical protein DL93DRAFT_1744645 [Clavulina sp. PMI_390]|nr:hypothetical protein DL93DRAFT_1744645 [Clavulina sp. PMI_390]